MVCSPTFDFRIGAELVSIDPKRNHRNLLAANELTTITGSSVTGGFKQAEFY
jgi:hypothetical protein